MESKKQQHLFELEICCNIDINDTFNKIYLFN